MDVERAIVAETAVEALAGDSVERAVEEETAATARDDAERWPRLPRTASTPRASPPAEPREFVFVSGASVLVPPSPAPHRRRRRRRAHAAEEPAPGDERRRRGRRRRRRRKPQGVSPLASPTSSLNFPDWASPTSSIASALSSPWSSPRPHLGEQHHFPRGDSSSSSFWSSTSSLWSSTTSMFSSTTSSLRSWASSSSASSLLFSAAPAQGDGPDHYRPDSPDDFRVACRDVSMPLPE